MRRTFVDRLSVGPLRLEPDQAHHLRDVLRLGVGEIVELFDAGGRRATAKIEQVDRDGVLVQITQIDEVADGDRSPMIHVASAVPKADRADWLVEKLSEIGVARWLPLRTARSVVHPEGVAKYERWRRLAIEAAKQSRRVGVMEIAELVSFDEALHATSDDQRIVLSTREKTRPLINVVERHRSVTLFVGPEGGWTESEIGTLAEAGAIEASLTATVLRVETAAIVAAGIIAALA